MKTFIAVYREIRRGSSNEISPREAAIFAEQLLSLYRSDQSVDEDEWGRERKDEHQLIPVDEMLLERPDLLLKHERNTLRDIYGDEEACSETKLKRIYFEWASV